jgi:hypothetical protein
MISLKRWGVLASAMALGAVGAVAAGTVAMAGHGNDKAFTITARLSGYNETPLALSSAGSGSVRLRIDPRAQTIRYTLRYANLEGTVTQSHIHFGSVSQTGGVSVFLCTNLGNGPAGTQACPAAPATITGTIKPADVIGPAGQGIGPGEFDEFMDALEAGVTYVNVHSDKYPGGEIRAQIDADRRGGH